MCSTLLDVRGNINDTVVKTFDSVITLNDIFITSPTCSTLLEVRGNINDTVVKAFDTV